MNQIKFNGHQFEVPALWDEITSEQMIQVAPLIFGPPETLLIRKGLVLQVLLPAVKRYYNRLTDFQKWDLFNTVDWIFKDFTGRSVVRHFKHKEVEYHLPEDNLRKESIIAYAFADTYFQHFIDSRDPAWIDKVIGCLARQVGSKQYPALQRAEGDIREHFSTSRSQERSEVFADLPFGVKNAILLFFMGSKKYISKQYEVLFTQKEPEPDGKKKHSFGQKKIPKPEYGWIGVIYDLAQQNTFGGFDQVKHQFLHTCCYYLTKLKYEQEERTT